MNQIKIGNKVFSLTNIILFALVTLEFIFVAYCNLFKIPVTLDNDAAKVFTHAIEMWNAKTIFIPNWVNETMLELDTALIFAIPIYAITGDIIISFGISNIIILLLFYFFICSILKRMNQPLSIQLICCGLITIPYSFGQLLYFNMMFFSGAFYGIKILLPFMFIWLLTTPALEKNLLYYFVLSISVIFTFLFSVSTGPYTLLCAILPIALCYIWIEFGLMTKIADIFSKWLFSFNSIIMLVLIVSALGGIALGNIMNVDSTGSAMSVIEYADFTDNFLWLIDGFIELLGASPYEEVSMLSFYGITALSHYAVALIALITIPILFVTGIRKLISIKEFSLASSVYYYIFVLFAINLVVIILCTIFTNCRYELMNIIPAIPLCVILINDSINKMAGNIRQISCRFVLLILFVVVALTSNYKILKNDCRPEMAANNIKYEKVVDILHSLPEKQIFLLDDEGRAEVLRAIDHKSDKEYLAYMFCDNGVSVHDYYASHTDASFFDDNHLLIVDEYVSDISNLPPYISSLYEEIDNYQGVHIYRASENRMDGVVGYESNPSSIDYFYAKGYEIYNGSISDDDGSLRVIGNGDIAVSSPWLINNSDSVSVTLDYSASAGASASNVSESGDRNLGKIVITNPETGELLSENELSATDSSVTLSDIDVKNAYYILVQISINEGIEVNLNSIKYDALSK